VLKGFKMSLGGTSYLKSNEFECALGTRGDKLPSDLAGQIEDQKKSACLQNYEKGCNLYW